MLEETKVADVNQETSTDGYPSEWFTLRNIKPTEMELWAGDKRLVNIQGKYTDELVTFINMANLGIIAHREEIRQRVEALLEQDGENT